MSSSLHCQLSWVQPLCTFSFLFAAIQCAYVHLSTHLAAQHLCAELPSLFLYLQICLPVCLSDALSQNISPGLHEYAKGISPGNNIFECMSPGCANIPRALALVMIFLNV